MRKLSAIFLIIVTFPACEYSTVDECIVKETQKSSGVVNSSIKRFCAEKFIKEEKPEQLRIGIDYTVDLYLNTLVVKNYSDKPINYFKIFVRTCGTFPEVDWNSQKNNLAGVFIISGREHKFELGDNFKLPENTCLDYFASH